MITTVEVDSPGMLRDGDLILIEKQNGVVFPAIIKKAINSGTENEEILFNKRRNLYFILSMMLDGSSWVKSCHKVFEGKMYDATNNMHAWVS